jgi:hypothetical protein
MIYRWFELYSEHWQTLAETIEENYGTMEDPGSTVIFSLHHHRPAKEIKEMLNCGKLIVYQTEPLVENHWWKPDKIIRNIESADEVWDYDLENIMVLEKHGIKAKYRPPKYSHKLKTVNNIENPDIDVLFYGSITERRSKFISHCLTSAIIKPEDTKLWLDANFVYVFNTFGKKLDEYMARSKIILNLNPYDGECRQQQTRIYHSLINEKCVLSEKNKFNYYGNLICEFENGNVQDMFEKIIYLLRDDRWKTYANDNYKKMYDKQLSENILR